MESETIAGVIGASTGSISLLWLIIRSAIRNLIEKGKREQQFAQIWEAYRHTQQRSNPGSEMPLPDEVKSSIHALASLPKVRKSDYPMGTILALGLGDMLLKLAKKQNLDLEDLMVDASDYADECLAMQPPLGQTWWDRFFRKGMKGAKH